MCGSSNSRPPGGWGGHFLMSHPQVGLECVFTFRFNLGSLGSTLSIVVATPVLGPSSSTLGVPFLTSRSPLGGPSCIFMPSLFFVDAALSFVSITRDISESELRPGSGKSGKKCSNKRRICRALLPRKSWQNTLPLIKHEGE